MRLSKAFGRTLREVPAEAEMISHKLLLRAGMIRPLTSGIYTYLPLGWRVLHKIASVVREELAALGGQEMYMPVVQPAELWQTSGRWDATLPEPGPALARFKDRYRHEMALAYSHEEAIAELAHREISSYRQLPFLLYGLQSRFRDEPRSQGGPASARESLAADAYSGHTDLDGLEATYTQMNEAYVNIFRRCGLEAMATAGETTEFVVTAGGGSETLILCPECGYVATAETATFAKSPGPQGTEKPVEAVETPGCKTIEAVANFVGVGTDQTLKAVFYADDWGTVIFVVIRGDLEVNEAKLLKALGDKAVHVALEDELAAAGIVAGYASPVGVEGVRVIADDSIRLGCNFVAGANREGYHLLNVNYPRDFSAEVVTDIAQARAGHACSHCGAALTEREGIRLGHLSKPGTRYSQAAGATYLDEAGQAHPIVMGAYSLDLGRLMAAVVEQHHDDKGLVWPRAIAPYDVHLVALGLDKPKVAEIAEALYRDLPAEGFAVLYDDRNESAGVKFNDADLIGVPLRLTVSSRSLKRGGVEMKLRAEKEFTIVAPGEVVNEVRQVVKHDSNF